MGVKKKKLTIILVLGWFEIEKYDLLLFSVKITKYFFNIILYFIIINH